jgi:hypothetical protein
MIKPDEVFDCKGIPVYPGDLIRSKHFVGKRRKQYYLYHVAVWNSIYKCLEMVPTCCLEPTKDKGGGRCWLTQELMDNAEIISGFGPEFEMYYDERPKRKTDKRI